MLVNGRESTRPAAFTTWKVAHKLRCEEYESTKACWISILAKVAPGGYLWVFPKGKDSANVGIGISVESAKGKSAIRWLDEFVRKRFPDAAILTRIAGGVPCAKTCDQIVKGNVMLVGDAAHQVNPVSGGGIISGMIGGMIAGQVAAETVGKRGRRSSA